MKKAPWFVFFSFLAVSCLNEPDCYLLNNDVIVLYFRVLGFGADSVYVADVRSPSTAVDGTFFADTTIAQFALSLNPVEEEALFVFNHGDSSRRLLLTYDRKFQFVSEDCGERLIFKDLKAPEYDFDSVQVVNPTPTRPASLNVNIFRCPTTNLMGLTFTTVTHVEEILAGDQPITLETEDISSILLPVDTTQTSTTYTFKFEADVTRTLKVNYTPVERILGHACGRTFFITELEVDESSNFTTLSLKNEGLADPQVTNIEAVK